MVDAPEQLTKGVEMMAHSLVLMRNRVAELLAANEAALRRKAHKKKRIRREGTLTVGEGVRLTTLADFKARSNRRKAKKRARAKEGDRRVRYYKTCGETSHNSQTYTK